MAAPLPVFPQTPITPVAGSSVVQSNAAAQSMLQSVNQIISYLPTLANPTFPSSIEANGYIELAGGLIVQWGQTGSFGTSSPSNLTITFPLPFPNAVFVVIPSLSPIATTGSDSGCGVYPKSLTLTNFVLSAEFDSGFQPNPTAYWIALGN